MNRLTVGQPVAVQSAYNFDSYSFGYTVTKVTPGGQVVVKREADPITGDLEHEMRFDKDGYRMSKGGGSRFRCERLELDVDAARESVRKSKAKSDAASAINAVRGAAGSRNDKESLQAQVVKLAELLDAARAAVEAI